MKNLKRLALVIAIVMLMGVFAACAESPEAQGSTAANTAEASATVQEGESGAGTYKIGSTANNVGTDAYQTQHDKTLREYAAEKGVDLVQLDATGDVTKQINQVDDLIQQGCDVIIIWPVNGKALVPAAKKASEAGIPVVIANSNIDESGYDYIKCFVGPDNVKEGELAGEMMMEAFPNGAKIVEITGLPGYTTATERSEGFRSKIEGSNIEIADSQPGDWNREKAQQQMENFLLKFSDIDAVYCADDNMAIGAINAIKEAGRMDQIKVISCCFFGDDEAKGYLESGEIAGSVLQSPMTDAKTTLDVALQVAAGEEVEFFSYIDTPKVTPETIGTIDLPAW